MRLTSERKGMKMNSEHVLVEEREEEGRAKEED